MKGKQRLGAHAKSGKGAAQLAAMQVIFRFTHGMDVQPYYAALALRVLRKGVK